MSADFYNSSPNTQSYLAGRRGDLVDSDVLPNDIRMQWNEQLERYEYYWSWWTGEQLEKKSPKLDRSLPDKLMYPMKINPIRQFSRKIVTTLFGESQDSSQPLVRTLVKPRPSPKPVEKSEKDLAENVQYLLNEVWMQSNARSIMLENGTYSQFLGGCVFKVEWRGNDEEARVPIYIKRIVPDYFIPVWETDDMWNLLGAYVVYYVEDTEAKIKYGLETSRNLYVEHWTKERIKIQVGSKVIMDDFNPFGFVPFVYIPKSREGQFYGPSIVDDINALVKEFNSRMANIGDTIKKNSQLLRFVTNLHNKNVNRIVFDRNQFFYDLGEQPNFSNAKTEIITEQPVNMPDSLVQWTQSLWTQLLRDSSLAPIVFGEDEGSQRSALTLAFRMWPLTSQVDIQRAYWDEGLTLIAKMIIKIILVKMPRGIKLGSETIVIPPDILRRVIFTHIWNPKIPRDREQDVNEAILMFQAGAIDLTKFHEMVGNVKDVDDIVARVLKWKKQLAEIDKSISGQPSNGAPTDIEKPVASTGYDKI